MEAVIQNIVFQYQRMIVSQAEQKSTFVYGTYESEGIFCGVIIDCILGLTGKERNRHKKVHISLYFVASVWFLE